MFPLGIIMTNCLFFAVALYWRRFAKAERAYFQWRKSDAGWFPHFLYCELRRGRLRQISYKPVHPKPHLLFPPPLFKGSVCWGDARHKPLT